MGFCEKNRVMALVPVVSGSRTVMWVGLCGAWMLLAGCANRRSPKAPTLWLPQAPHGLTTERTGDTVTLHWTTRPKTTDGDAIRGAVTAVVCRNEAPKAAPSVPVYPAPADPCKEVARVTVALGEAEVKDVLPARLTSGSPTLVAYRVQLLNARGHGLEASAPVYAVAGSAPAAAGGIAVEPKRNAVVVAWKAVRGEKAAMQVTRTLTATAAGPVVSKASKKDERSLGGSRARAIFISATPDGNEDPGGMTDRTIRDGDTVTYTAQRVLTVRLALPSTPPVEQDFVLRGEPSNAVRLKFEDVIPPGAPLGLVAVAGGGFGEAPSIDLSWEANEELDVAGYNVYRAEGASGDFRRVNADLVAGLAYRDGKVEAGKAYLYRVTAVDVRGHESVPGAVIAVSVKR